MFKKLIAGFAALTFALASVAASETRVDTQGMTDAQVAELKAHAAKVVADNAKGTTAGKVAEDPGALVTFAASWGPQLATAAEGIAKALALAAKELGVTINEFLKTDAGKLVAIGIIWKVFGPSILGLLYGAFFIAAGLGITRVLYKRVFTKEFQIVEYSWLGGFWKGTRLVRIPKNFSELKTDGEWGAFWVMMIVFMLTLGIAGVIIT